MCPASPLSPIWTLVRGSSPILATAIHAGHELRPDVEKRLLIDGPTRFREEDPYTDRLTCIADNRLTVHRSRFEMDVNRDRHHAVYLSQEDAWGLPLWKESPTPLLNESLQQYDAFYHMLHRTLHRMTLRHRNVIVLDIHSYNHHRQGPDAPFDDSLQNPEIEIGTDTMDRNRWAEPVDRFIDDLRRYDFPGHSLDVRENIKFGAGWMSEWIHTHFRAQICVISIELKKTFMDEWTGELHLPLLQNYQAALASAVPHLISFCSSD